MVEGGKIRGSGGRREGGGAMAGPFTAVFVRRPPHLRQALKAVALGGLATAFALPMATLAILNLLLGSNWSRALHRSKVC